MLGLIVDNILNEKFLDLQSFFLSRFNTYKIPDFDKPLFKIS